jgi:hypothetical protein
MNMAVAHTSRIPHSAGTDTLPNVPTTTRRRSGDTRGGRGAGAYDHVRLGDVDLGANATVDGRGQWLSDDAR